MISDTKIERQARIATDALETIIKAAGAGNPVAVRELLKLSFTLTRAATDAREKLSLRLAKLVDEAGGNRMLQ
jgi:enamine deaminase RidA (YjgF/YER057c/UK114 family)